MSTSFLLSFSLLNLLYCCNLDRFSLLSRIPVGVKIKVHNVFYTHTSIYSELILVMVPNTDNFHLTPCTIFRVKTSNTVSEFTHSTWITLSIIQVLNTRACFPKCLIHFSFTSVHSNLEHGFVILTESFSPL